LVAQGRAEANGHYVKIAKVKGEFVWHKHDNEGEPERSTASLR